MGNSIFLPAPWQLPSEPDDNLGLIVTMYQALLLEDYPMANLQKRKNARYIVGSLVSDHSELNLSAMNALDCSQCSLSSPCSVSHCWLVHCSVAVLPIIVWACMYSGDYAIPGMLMTIGPVCIPGTSHVVFAVGVCLLMKADCAQQGHAHGYIHSKQPASCFEDPALVK